MMYWTFDASRQDRQEILFGPYLTYPTYPTSHLLLPRCRRMLSSSLQEIRGCVQDCVTNLEEVHIHPLHVSSLPRKIVLVLARTFNKLHVYRYTIY